MVLALSEMCDGELGMVCDVFWSSVAWRCTPKRKENSLSGITINMPVSLSFVSVIVS